MAMYHIGKVPPMYREYQYLLTKADTLLFCTDCSETQLLLCLWLISTFGTGPHIYTWGEIMHMVPGHIYIRS